MIRKLISTSHIQKLLFDKILTQDLLNCKYKIAAFYEWKNKAQVFSAHFTDDENIKLSINLNFEEELFFGSTNAMELSICYRSYLISAYLRCLENAEISLPNTLFQGNVTLEAIIDIHSGNDIKLYSPFSTKGLSRQRVINIQCAIRSLSRMLIEQEIHISTDTRKRCEQGISWMITYTRLPEIEYIKAKSPEYAVLRNLRCVSGLIKNNPTLTKQYSIFAQCGVSNFDEETIFEILEKESLQNFWVESFLRVLAFSDNIYSSVDVTNLPKIKKAIASFREESVLYYQESVSSTNMLLTNNLLAVKKIAGKIDQVFLVNEPVKSGALHFIQ